jgi:peptidyl-prolyl cis-trans isomerase SurA
MKTFLLALAMAACAITSHAASDKVVAIVNEEVITASQVAPRTELLIRQMGATNLTPQQRELLGKRTLGKMIDEELARQYATKLGLGVAPVEVKNAIARLAETNPNFEAVTKGLEKEAGEQVGAELLWGKVVAEVLRPQIEVSNGEVDQLINDMLKSRHVLEREISQIYMGVEDPSQEDRVRAQAEQVLAELKAGKDFGELARAHSEDATSAANGGRMGWFATGELNPQMEDALSTLKPGTGAESISGLIRTPLGFHIVRLDNARTTKPINTGPVTEFNLVAIGRPLAASETTAAALADVQATTAKLTKGFAIESLATDSAFLEKWPQTRALGWMAPGSLQAAIEQAVQNLKPGQWSAPLQMPDGVGAIHVLGQRQSIAPELEKYRARVRGHLTTNRLDLASRRLTRELRQRAFVDVRW